MRRHPIQGQAPIPRAQECSLKSKARQTAGSDLHDYHPLSLLSPRSEAAILGNSCCKMDHPKSHESHETPPKTAERCANMRQTQGLNSDSGHPMKSHISHEHHPGTQAAGRGDRRTRPEPTIRDHPWVDRLYTFITCHRGHHRRTRIVISGTGSSGLAVFVRPTHSLAAACEMRRAIVLRSPQPLDRAARGERPLSGGVDTELAAHYARPAGRTRVGTPARNSREARLA